MEPSIFHGLSYACDSELHSEGRKEIITNSHNSMTYRPPPPHLDPQQMNPRLKHSTRTLDETASLTGWPAPHTQEVGLNREEVMACVCIATLKVMGSCDGRGR